MRSIEKWMEKVMKNLAEVVEKEATANVDSLAIFMSGRWMGTRYITGEERHVKHSGLEKLAGNELIRQNRNHACFYV